MDAAPTLGAVQLPVERTRTMRFALAAWTLPVLTVFVACRGGNSVGTPSSTMEASREIGPSGGLVVLPDGTSVSIPRGALSHDVDITLESVSGSPLPSAGTTVGQTYLLGPEGLQFNQPVTVTLAFDPSKIPSGQSADDLVVNTSPRSAPDAYAPLPTAEADSQHVYVMTTHFSYFVTVSPPEVSGVNVYVTTSAGGIAPDPNFPDGIRLVQASPGSPDCTKIKATEESATPPDFQSSDEASICVLDAPKFHYQQVVGIGAALTDSAAYDIVYRLPGTAKDAARLKGTQQQSLLKALFGVDDGIGLSLMRQPIGASDFTYDQTAYALVENQSKESSFTIAHDENYIIPTLKEAVAIAHKSSPQDDITFVGSAWSAPAWMKTNGTMFDDGKGNLIPGKEHSYAEYLAYAVKQYANDGVNLAYLTTLNEPGNGSGYAGMKLDEKQEQTIIGYLHDLLPDTRILGWDFNWTGPADTAEQKDGGLNPFELLAHYRYNDKLAGIAFHCYGPGNDPQFMTDLHDRHAKDPNKKDPFHLWVTECTSAWDDAPKLVFPEDAPPSSPGELGTKPVPQHHGEAIEQLIRAMRNWSETFATWNLALGPDLASPRERREHTGSGCNDCVGLVTIDETTGTWKPERDFAELGHTSAFVRPGATVLYSDTYSSFVDYTTGKFPSDRGGIETVAFQNSPGSVFGGGYVLVVYNSYTEPRSVQLRWSGSALPTPYTVPPRSAVTFTWGGSAFKPSIASPSPTPLGPAGPPPPSNDGGTTTLPDGGTCSPGQDACFENFGSGSTGVCDYNWSTVPGYSCPSGYSSGSCSAVNLQGCCVTTTELDGYLTTKATCYYDAALVASARLNCTSDAGGTQTWTPCLP
jgi:glucosylceramidase